MPLASKGCVDHGCPCSTPTVKEAAVTDAITFPRKAFSHSVDRTSDQSEDAGART